uniref:Uncharacterized protein n=1 Tax=Arundo donax TaxID=35708 RepID=A0A0A8YH36_ARUDO
MASVTFLPYIYRGAPSPLMCYSSTHSTLFCRAATSSPSRTFARTEGCKSRPLEPRLAATSHGRDRDWSSSSYFFYWSSGDCCCSIFLLE